MSCSLGDGFPPDNEICAATDSHKGRAHFYMVFIAEAVETRRGEEGCSPLRALLQKPQLLL